MTQDEKISLVERILKSGDQDLAILHYKISLSSGRIIITGMPFDGRLYYNSCEEFCFGNPNIWPIATRSFLTLMDSLSDSTLEPYKNLAWAYSKARSVLKGVSSWEELELRLDIADL